MSYQRELNRKKQLRFISVAYDHRLYRKKRSHIKFWLPQVDGQRVTILIEKNPRETGPTLPYA